MASWNHQTAVKMLFVFSVLVSWQKFDNCSIFLNGASPPTWKVPHQLQTESKGLIPGMLINSWTRIIFSVFRNKKLEVTMDGCFNSLNGKMKEEFKKGYSAKLDQRNNQTIVQQDHHPSRVEELYVYFYLTREMLYDAEKEKVLKEKEKDKDKARVLLLEQEMTIAKSKAEMQEKTRLIEKQKAEKEKVLKEKVLKEKLLKEKVLKEKEKDKDKARVLLLEQEMTIAKAKAEMQEKTKLIEKQKAEKDKAEKEKLLKEKEKARVLLLEQEMTIAKAKAEMQEKTKLIEKQKAEKDKAEKEKARVLLLEQEMTIAKAKAEMQEKTRLIEKQKAEKQKVEKEKVEKEKARVLLLEQEMTIAKAKAEMQEKTRLIEKQKAEKEKVLKEKARVLLLEQEMTIAKAKAEMQEKTRLIEKQKAEKEKAEKQKVLKEKEKVEKQKVEKVEKEKARVLLLEQEMTIAKAKEEKEEAERSRKSRREKVEEEKRNIQEKEVAKHAKVRKTFIKSFLIFLLVASTIIPISLMLCLALTLTSQSGELPANDLKVTSATHLTSGNRLKIDLTNKNSLTFYDDNEIHETYQMVFSQSAHEMVSSQSAHEMVSSQSAHEMVSSQSAHEMVSSQSAHEMVSSESSASDAKSSTLRRKKKKSISGPSLSTSERSISSANVFLQASRMAAVSSPFTVSLKTRDNREKRPLRDLRLKIEDIYEEPDSALKSTNSPMSRRTANADNQSTKVVGNTAKAKYSPSPDNDRRARIILSQRSASPCSSRGGCSVCPSRNASPASFPVSVTATTPTSRSGKSTSSKLSRYNSLSSKDSSICQLSSSQKNSIPARSLTIQLKEEFSYSELKSSYEKSKYTEEYDIMYTNPSLPPSPRQVSPLNVSLQREIDRRARARDASRQPGEEFSYGQLTSSFEKAAYSEEYDIMCRNPTLLPVPGIESSKDGEDGCVDIIPLLSPRSLTSSSIKPFTPRGRLTEAKQLIERQRQNNREEFEAHSTRSTASSSTQNGKLRRLISISPARSDHSEDLNNLSPTSMTGSESASTFSDSQLQSFLTRREKMLISGDIFLDDFIEDNDCKVNSPRSEESFSLQSIKNVKDRNSKISSVSSMISNISALMVTIPDLPPLDVKKVFTYVSPRAPSPFRSQPLSAPARSPARIGRKSEEVVSSTAKLPLHVTIPSSGGQTGNSSRAYPYLSPRPASPFRSPARSPCRQETVEESLSKGRVALEKGMGRESRRKMKGTKSTKSEASSMTKQTLTLHSKLISDLESSSPFITLQRESSSTAMTDTSQSGSSSPQKI